MNSELIQLLGSAARGEAIHVDARQFFLTISLAILFGTVLKLLYEAYFQDNEPQDSSLARGMILLTPALTAIFWMVQANLTLSLGLFGSLSLIRFRSSVKRVEDIAFIVVMLTVALALAVKAPGIATILLGILFLYAVTKNRAALLFKRESFALITFNTRQLLQSDEIVATLEERGIQSEFVSSRTYDGITSYVFSSRKVGRAMHAHIQRGLIELDAGAQINIFYPHERLGA